LVSARTFGYGSYRFELNSPVDKLNPNAVLGLFTWSDDPEYADREIDIECSRWSNASDVNNAQFVVQPFNIPGHLVRLAVPSGLTNSTVLFTWETNQVNFQAMAGSYTPNPTSANVISNWSYTLTVPPTGDENVRLNLWLFNGSPPSDNQEVEVIIRSFEFVPLGPPQPATLDNASQQAGGQAHFTINGQPDRRYQVQISTNLSDWQGVTVLLATNSFLDFLDTTSFSAERRFFRTLTLP
jgi:hypothetical protein